MQQKMKQPQFKSRKSIRKTQMANNNSLWIRSDTEENINQIVNFMINDYKETKKKRRISFAQLSRELEIQPSSVSYSAHVLCFLRKPKFKMFAEPILSKNGKMRTMMRLKMR